jgi:hypothetical protein
MGKLLSLCTAAGLAAIVLAGAGVTPADAQHGRSRGECRNWVLSNPLYRHHPGSGCDRRCGAAVRRCMAGEI